MEKRKLIKLAAIMTAAIMCISLVACGSTPAGKSGAVSETTSGATMETESESADVISSSEMAAIIEAKYSMIAPYFDSVESIEKETYPYYNSDSSHNAVQSKDIDLYFVNGNKQIPYIDMETAVERIIETAHLDPVWEDYNLEMVTDGNGFYLSRENTYVAFILPEENKIYFPDIDNFFVAPSAANGLDVTTIKSPPAKPIIPSEDDEAEDDSEPLNLLSRRSVSYVEGEMQIYDLGAYNIEFIEKDGTWYVPLQTVSDVFTAPLYYNLTFNGKVVIAMPYLGTLNVSGIGASEIGQLYSDAEVQPRSEELIQFNYNELCMIMDYVYGLAEEHNITGFDDFFIRSGLTGQLFSENAMDTYNALYTLTNTLLSDGHSTATAQSPWSDTSNVNEADFLLKALDAANTDFGRFSQSAAKYQKIRGEVAPEGLPGYQEVGNTAYITFDSFTYDTSIDYYNIEITNNSNDTIELLCYANQQLHREGCPIENVVIDLSNNVGGAADAAACVIAWFLSGGNTAFQNVKSQATGIVYYNFDANLDREINSGDMLEGFNLYCVISPVSFSCGNLVPASFKGTDKVTLLGRKTGGGACVVRTLSTADGTLFNASGPTMVSYSKNGAIYGADQGIEPDIYINDFSMVYDRQTFTDYINNLK